MPPTVGSLSILSNVMKIVPLRHAWSPSLWSRVFKLTANSDYDTWGLRIELRQSGLHSEHLERLRVSPVWLSYDSAICLTMQCSAEHL